MRNPYIREQKEIFGRKVLAVLPVHYPKEILTALDILAVEMWGPPGTPRGPDAGRLQAYVCAVARNALAFMASGGADAVDGALFPHTCDSIQGLATQAPDMGGWTKPSFRFIHPKGEWRPSSHTFVEKEMRSLAGELEAFAGKPLDETRLRDAVRLHREIDDVRAELLANRSRIEMNDREFYTLLRRGEYLWPEEHLDELRAARENLRSDTVQKGIPIMITGYVPEPMSIFDAIGNAGAFVAVDDYAAVGRRVVRPAAEAGEDPFRDLADAYFQAPPCPTRSSNRSIRMAWLAGLYDKGGAAGVIVHEPKFCEPELFDVPGLRETFSAKKAPLLYLEGELETELPGQAVTRIEAFVEMLGSGSRA
ncbi:2-hydroxyacyl-CoA dehydratase family protein [bacterium]|nr:2-hydroxyacyl-CoA dehydratase family protein [bacterium]